MLKHVVQYLLLIAGFLSLPFVLYFALVVFDEVEEKGDQMAVEDEGVVAEASPLAIEAAAEPIPSAGEALSDGLAKEGEVVGLYEVSGAFWLKRRDNGMYETVANLSWIADGVDEAEVEPVEVLVELGLDEPMMAVQYLETPWFSDGLTEDEGWAFMGLTYIDGFVAEDGNLVGQLPWVIDGISEDESMAAFSVSDIGFDFPDAANALISKSWFRDGITSDEADVLLALALLSHETGAAGLFVDMPFMESIEETDALALFSLHRLAVVTWRRFMTPSEFELFIAHPVIADGITDEEAVFVILGASAYEENSELAVGLLEPGGVMLESRSISLPMAGDVELVIARVESGPARSMDVLESAVRFTESYMDEPFPVGVVLLLYADAVEDGVAGFNLGTNMVIHPDFEIDDESEEAVGSELVTMHEVAHFYWHGSSEEWIDEGAAEFLNAAYVEHLTGVGVRAVFAVSKSEYDCTVEYLEVVEAMDESEAGDCPYKLGLGFFVDLYDLVGDVGFQQAYRSLYRAGQDVWDPDSDDARGVGHIGEAFGGEAMEEVMSRWYGEDGGE